MILLLLLDYPELNYDVSMMGLLQFMPFTAFVLYISLEIISRLKRLKKLFDFLTSLKMGLLLIGLLIIQWTTAQFLNYSNDLVIDLVLLAAFIPSIYLYVLLSNKWGLFNSTK